MDLHTYANVERVHLIENPITGQVQVYVLGRVPGGGRVYHDGQQWQELTEAHVNTADDPGVISLPVEALDAIVAERTSRATADQALIEHRDDTVYVRDQLLDMVKQIVDDYTSAPAAIENVVEAPAPGRLRGDH